MLDVGPGRQTKAWLLSFNPINLPIIAYVGSKGFMEKGGMLFTVKVFLV